MRFLVTGTAGFIGFHVARRLLEDGHFVVGFDGMTPYYDLELKRARQTILERSEGFRGVLGRLEDRAALGKAAELADPEVIIHLAAQPGVRYSIEAPRAYVDSNLVGSWTLLELARELRPRHLLLASTSSVYAGGEDFPYSETDPANTPFSLYAATKKGMEAMAHSYAHLFGVPTTLFRFFTVYGPWGRPDMAMYKFTEAILNGRPIDVYGHGRMERDFTYVDDLVEALVRLVDHVPLESSRVTAPEVEDSLSRHAPCRIVNIAGGRPVPLMDFIRAIEAAAGRRAELNMLDMQPGDVTRTHADPALLQALTGYVPDTPVEKGVVAFVDWYREIRGA